MDADIDLTGLERDEYAFPGPLRDRLVAAILSGEKTATTSLLAEYEHDHDSLPQVGKLSVVLDSQNHEVCVTRLEGMQVVRLADITLDHAVSEGEGYTTVSQWRKAHEEFWYSDEFLREIGNPDFAVDDDTLAVCERFRVIQML